MGAIWWSRSKPIAIVKIYLKRPHQTLNYVHKLYIFICYKSNDFQIILVFNHNIQYLSISTNEQLHIHLYIRPLMYPSIYIITHLSIHSLYISTHSSPLIYPPIYIITHLSIHLYYHSSIHPFIIYIHPFISTHLSIHSSIYPLIYPLIHISLHFSYLFIYTLLILQVLFDFCV